MSLVTRFSAFFLLAMAVILVGFSASVYSLFVRRMYLGLDSELRAKLDRFEASPEFDDRRVSWGFYDESGQPFDGSPEFLAEIVLGDLPASRLKENVILSIKGRAGTRWRVLLRRTVEGRRRRGPGGGGRRGGEGPGEAGKSARGGRRDDGTDGLRKRDMEKGGRDRMPAQWVAAGARLGPLESDQLALAGILTIVSLGLWSAAAIVGRYLGKRSLAPLVAMAAAARAMPFADGHSRLPSPGTRDELELFASSFNGLLDRLHEALERQKQFTGQASHQLRTPLAGVITAIEVARRRDRSAAQLEQVLDRVHDDALRLWRVIESLLFLARADAEAGLPDLERIDLTSWIGEHLARWSEHERAPDIEFRADPDHGNEAVVVRAHAGLLAQLLDNLLENACKYSASGAEITIRAHADQAWGYLTVADRGRGIAADDLSRVFEPFYRSSESARRGDAGVGLGLAVVRRIATSVGGSVSVESEPGRGSRFVVRLPRFAENRAPVKATEVEC